MLISFHLEENSQVENIIIRPTVVLAGLPVCRWQCGVNQDQDYVAETFLYFNPCTHKVIKNLNKKKKNLRENHWDRIACVWKWDYSLGDVDKDVFSSVRGPYESVTLRPGEVFTHSFKNRTWSCAYCPAQSDTEAEIYQRNALTVAASMEQCHIFTVHMGILKVTVIYIFLKSLFSPQTPGNPCVINYI